MKKVLALLLTGLLTGSAWAQTGVAVPELAHCDELIEQFRQRWKIPGVSVAISRHGRLVYARGFGHADLARTVPMQPHHQLRVASVSKPVTAVAVLKLAEDGRLDLDHRVFGPEGYLTAPYYNEVIRDERIYDITLRQLLEHSAGWNRNAGMDGFASSDPIEFPLHVTESLQVPNPVGDSTLLRFMLGKGLDFRPGSRFAYSNVGYLVLGKVLEKVTGQSYATWVRQQVLAPAGVREAHLGRNLLADKLPYEAEYFSKSSALSCYGTGEQVPLPYGGRNLEAMSAHGGWVFSARDLVRFMLAVDGSPSRPDLLTPASVASMVEPSEQNRRYAKGWMVTKDRVRWHTGALDGTASCVATNSEGYTWAILLNGRPAPNRFWNELEDLGWDCIGGSNNWPTFDLMPPTEPVSRLRYAPVAAPDAARLSWRKGNGSHRLVLLREGSPVDVLPQEGRSYAASSVFGLGAGLGHDTFVVGAGADTALTVSNLKPGHAYYLSVFEYQQTDATGQQPVYAFEGHARLQFNQPVPAVLAKAHTKQVKKSSRSRQATAGNRRKAQPDRPVAAPETTAPTDYMAWLREKSRGIRRWLSGS
ncbi:serine hydrolase domain-containing protein [Hymenobacter sp. B81]|uniref:serine hydrolase domain-containing protein n=1 Tax=Hymenobacter sp. B81 TaxID=3344878 RepID=UPI0037DD92FD